MEPFRALNRTREGKRGMPPVIIVALGAVGAAALIKLLAKESRRVNAELDEVRRETAAESAPPHGTLQRDPATGEYRPRQ